MPPLWDNCANFVFAPLPSDGFALRNAFLHIFRHIAQISLDGRDLPPAGEVSRSDRGADRQTSPPADFCLVLVKIMLENPHTFLVKTGSEKQSEIMRSRSRSQDNVFVIPDLI